MPSFYCKAVHSEGHLIDEVREADNKESIINELQREGYVPINITTTNNAPFYLLTTNKRRLSNKQILVFTQELATLLGAGLPLDHALKLVLDLASSNEEVNSIATFALKKVKQGVSLSDALEQQACGFSTFYIGIIKSGEASGNIADSLHQLSDYLERAESLRGTVISALVYPAILLLTSVASIILLMTLVLPQFAELFDSAGKELPLPTIVVMYIANGLQTYWWLIILISIGVLLTLQHILTTPPLRRRLDESLLTWPLIGDFLRKVEITRFSQSLGSLLKNGISLLDALLIVKRIMRNGVMVDLMDSACQNVKKGNSLSAAFEGEKQFPKMAIQMIKLGEETGQLQGMLTKLATIYDQEVKASVQRMLSLFEPLLILILGLIISGIIFSVLLAVVSINDFVF